MQPIVNLIADIGGTNARFALTDVHNGATSVTYNHEQQLKCADFTCVSEAIRSYLQDISIKSINRGCLAVAAPVDDQQRVSMTNNHWSFAAKELQKSLGVEEISIINDFAAIAHAVPQLTESDRMLITKHGSQISADGKQQTFAVVGRPGTGLGVAGLSHCDNQFKVLTSEAGHMSFSPENPLELEIYNYLHQKFVRLSYERLLSGAGIVNLYQALAEISGKEPQNLVAGTICQNAVNGVDDLCEQALHSFCGILGAFAGDIALAFNSTDGVYIAGGILPRYKTFLKNSAFIERFTNKGRYAQLMETIPVQLITHANPGLLGSAACLSGK